MPSRIPLPAPSSMFGAGAFSGRGAIPHRRYLRGNLQEPASARCHPCGAGVSRPGAMPGPTVTVRMKEIRVLGGRLPWRPLGRAP